MDNFEILLTVMLAGFGFQGALMFILWNSQKDIRNELSDLRKDVQDIDRRLCRIEGAMSAKDCCMLKEEKMKKAE